MFRSSSVIFFQIPQTHISLNSHPIHHPNTCHTDASAAAWCPTWPQQQDPPRPLLEGKAVITHLFVCVCARVVLTSLPPPMGKQGLRTVSPLLLPGSCSRTGFTRKGEKGKAVRHSLANAVEFPIALRFSRSPVETAPHCPLYSPTGGGGAYAPTTPVSLCCSVYMLCYDPRLPF